MMILKPRFISDLKGIRCIVGSENSSNLIVNIEARHDEGLVVSAYSECTESFVKIAYSYRGSVSWGINVDLGLLIDSLEKNKVSKSHIFLIKDLKTDKLNIHSNLDEPPFCKIDNAFKKLKYPKIRDDLDQYRMYTSYFIRGLDKTYRESSPDMKKRLNGVYGHSNKGRLVFVASNGETLVEYKAPCLWIDEGAKNFIIPREYCRSIVDILKNTAYRLNTKKMNTEISVSVENDILILQAGGSELQLPLLSGEYPDYRRAIPSKVDTNRFCISSKVLNASINEAMKEANAIKIKKSKILLKMSVGSSGHTSMCYYADDHIVLEYETHIATQLEKTIEPFELVLSALKLRNVCKAIDDKFLFFFVKGDKPPEVVFEDAACRTKFVIVNRRS